MVATAIYCYHGVVERNRISSLQSHGKVLEKECCLPGIFCDSGDTPANLLLYFYPGTQFPGSEKITLLLLFVFGVVYLVDIWNMIEAFREAGLSSLDPAAKVPLDVLEMLLSCIFCALNKRLPNSAQIDVAESVQSLFSFLVCAYDVYAFNSSYFLCHPTHPHSMRIRVYVTQ